MSTSVRWVSKPKMVMRSLRVPEKLWEAAKAEADRREENISDVIRAALEQYAAGKSDGPSRQGDDHERRH